MSGPPPPTYVCNRCSQSGHWYKNCPMLNTRRTTGITMEELMETTPDDPLAMLHPSGKFVVPIMHWKARQKKPEVAQPEPEIREVPPELKCPLCSQLLRDAVLTTCCGDSFCADCLQQRLLETPNAKCPGANCFQTAVSADKLVPNLKMRQAVEAFKHAAIHVSTTSSTTDSSRGNSPRVDEQPVQSVSRVRIGLSGRPQQIQSTVIMQQQLQHQQQPQQQQQVTTNLPQPQIVAAPPTYIQPSPLPTVLQSQIPVQHVVTSNSLLTSSGVAIASSQREMIPSTTVASNMQHMTAPRPSLPLPVNVHQPPPGYPIIHHPSEPLPVAPSSSVESIASDSHTSRSMSVIHMSAPPPLLPPGVQPPPPGLSAATTYPPVQAPPPIKDAWDEFLERKEKESRQRAALPSSRRRRRSTRSRSYSSSSSSSETSTDSSRSHSRSFSRDRDRSRRDRRRDGREKRSSRRRDSRSPFRNSYASTRYHRDALASSCSFYQHPPPGPANIGLPGASLIHHRIPSLLSTYSTQYAPVQTNHMASYSAFSNAPVSNFRSSRGYVEERSRRRTPRSTQSRRRSDSKEKENDRKERVEERKRTKDGDEKARKEGREVKKTKEDTDKEERRQKRDKYKRRDEKDVKEVESGHEGAEEGSNVRMEEEKETEIDKFPCDKEDTNEKIAVENIQVVCDDEKFEPKIVNVSEFAGEKENDAQTVDEDVTDVAGALASEKGAVNIGISHDDSSGAEVENETEGMEKEDDDVTKAQAQEGKERSERKRHKKKRKRHRRHEDDDEQDGGEPGNKKHRKHKRSKEERDRRKQEKEKRREERRKRKLEKEAERKGSAAVIVATADGCGEVAPSGHDPVDGDNLTLDEIKKDADRYAEVNSRKSETLISEEKVTKESRSRETQEDSGAGKKASGKEERSSLKTGEQKDEEKYDKREKERRHRHGSHRKRDESKESPRSSRKRSDDMEIKTKDEKDSRRKGDKMRKSERKEEKKESGKSFKKEEKSKEVEKESKRREKAEVCPKKERDSRNKESGDKRKGESDRTDHKRLRLTDNVKSHEKSSRDGHDDSSKPSEKQPKNVSSHSSLKTSDEKERRELPEVSPGVRNENDQLFSDQRKSSSRMIQVPVPVGAETTHTESDRKRLDEIKVSIEKELERKVEALPTPSGNNMPNLTVELKSGGEKRVTRENVFEGVTPHFNARQKIKMILLSESERHAVERSKKKTGAHE